MTDVMAELENIFYKGERKGEKKGIQKGIKKEQANSEKKMNLFVKRIAKRRPFPKSQGNQFQLQLSRLGNYV